MQCFFRRRFVASSPLSLLCLNQEAKRMLSTKSSSSVFAAVSSPEAIRRLLQRKHIAVVGISTEPSKPSYHVAEELQKHGYKIIPVRPGDGTILGEKIVNRLSDIPQTLMQDDVVVDVFRRPQDAEQVVDDAIAAHATGIWFQLGVVNEKAVDKAVKAGMVVVVDRCTWIEYQKGSSNL